MTMLIDLERQGIGLPLIVAGKIVRRFRLAFPSASQPCQKLVNCARDGIAFANARIDRQVAIAGSGKSRDGIARALHGGYEIFRDFVAVASAGPDNEGRGLLAIVDIAYG